MNTEYYWSDIFVTGNTPEGMTIRKAVADALVGWGNCMVGAEPPQMFGMGMMRLGEICDIVPTPENFYELAKKIVSEKKTEATK